MTNDPIVDEIRAGREKYAASFDFDVRAMLNDVKKRQDASGRTVVSYEKVKRGRTGLSRAPSSQPNESDNDCNGRD